MMEYNLASGLLTCKKLSVRKYADIGIPDLVEEGCRFQRDILLCILYSSSENRALKYLNEALFYQKQRQLLSLPSILFEGVLFG